MDARAFLVRLDDSCSEHGVVEVSILDYVCTSLLGFGCVFGSAGSPPSLDARPCLKCFILDVVLAFMNWAPARTFQNSPFHATVWYLP